MNGGTDAKVPERNPQPTREVAAVNATVTPEVNSLEPAIAIGLGTAKEYVFVHWRPTVAELERIVAEYKAALEQRTAQDRAGS